MENLHFPHWEQNDNPLEDTILDGELVIDVDPKTGQVSPFCVLSISAGRRLMDVGEA